MKRCSIISGVDEVVCATTNLPGDDVLASHLCSDWKVIRGSSKDVLSRYMLAAYEMAADVIVRITGDCPHICPNLCSAVVRARADANADYASNIDPRTFPKGLDCEVFLAETLHRADWRSLQDDREHVTPWMLRSPDVKRVNVHSPWPMDGRLTLDTEDDYKVICAAFGDPPKLMAA